ncbi:MAG: outer membrane protein assembly factor BamD [Thermoanaerobaculia bacterium]|nr:outer membrane protein assembly factor BamD [Thermoanaerobaculia bacterium]
MKKTLTLIAILSIALAGCRHFFHRGNTGGGSSATKSLRSTFDPALMKMPKEQVFQLGEDQFAKKKYQRARQYYSHVYETFPNDPLGRRALLRVADSYYEQGDSVNLIEAQYKYRDFINRYPGSDRADYAMLQIAMCSYKQMERPDRDQQKTREALEKFNDVLKTYPKSALRPEMDKRLQDVLDRLARHDHIIARYYIKRHSFNAALQRLNGIVEIYPNYAERDGVFYDLGTSLSGLGRTAEARLYFERVLSEFPQSTFAAKAKQKLGSMKTA